MQRWLLAGLFVALSAGLAATAVYSAVEGGRAWVIAVTAGALAFWMADLARRFVTPRRS